MAHTISVGEIEVGLVSSRCEPTSQISGFVGFVKQPHRQRTDGRSSAGCSTGVAIGMKPTPLTVTIVPPRMGPPVGSMLCTSWTYWVKVWYAPYAPAGHMVGR